MLRLTAGTDGRECNTTRKNFGMGSGGESLGPTKLIGEPGLGGAPVAQDGGFGNVEQLGCFGNVEAAEEAAFDHHGLALVHSCEFVECAIEREQIFAATGNFFVGGVEGDGNFRTGSALSRIAAARGFNQQLAHSAGGDALEMQARGGRDLGRFCELDPGFVDERGGIQSGAGVTAADGGGEAPQLLVSRTK